MQNGVLIVDKMVYFLAEKASKVDERVLAPENLVSNIKSDIDFFFISGPVRVAGQD